MKLPSTLARFFAVAEGAYEAALPYLFQRKQFGTLIGDFQGMQHQYAQAAVDIEACRLMVYNAARRKMVCFKTRTLRNLANHHSHRFDDAGWAVVRPRSGYG